MEKKTIPQNKLAQYRHYKFMVLLGKTADVAYKIIMLKTVEEIKKKFKKEKLAKSSAEDLGTGWTEGVNRIEMDLNVVIAPVISKHLSALKWVLMGDFADKEAKKMAKTLGLIGKVTPGLVMSSYLHSIDANSEHYEDLFGKTAPEMPTTLLKGSVDQIIKRTNVIINQAIAQIEFGLLESLQRILDSHNLGNLMKVHEIAHDNLPVDGDAAVAEANEEVSQQLKIRDISEELTDTVNKMENKWSLAANSTMSQASALGTHQALLEIHGSENPDVRVCWIEMEDERVCQFCKEASKKKDGTYKYYKISDFEPTGYNYGKKRSEWKLCVPGAHPRCRCELVVVPVGFDMSDAGTIIPKKNG